MEIIAEDAGQLESQQTASRSPAMITAASTTNPRHDHQHFELWQTDHGHQTGGVHDGVVCVST
jgi:hypothetical protein